MFTFDFDRIYTKVNKRGGITTYSYILIKNGCIITVTENNINIENSYRIDKRKDIEAVISYVYYTYSNNVTKNRSGQSCIDEWIAHNNLYKLHIEQDRTRSVDLQYPVKWYEPIVYKLLSIIAL